MAIELKEHALVQHYITILRNKETKAELFRKASVAVTRILMVEAARSLSLETVSVSTPLEETQGAKLSGGLVVVPILRAGLGMLETALKILPNAAVGFVGLERDEATAIASCYYAKLPPLNTASHVFVIDPMLATGGSAVQTITSLKAKGVQRLTMVSIISAPEGVAALEAAHPDVEIVTGIVDRELNESKYICPGLGDFGDRLFRTSAASSDQ